MSPTQRTLKRLRDDDWVVDVVERFIPGAKIRRDWCGFADLIACHERDGFLAVQCTTMAHRADRVKKMRDNQDAARWLRAGGTIEVWGWRKVGGKWEPGITTMWERPTRTVGVFEVLGR